MSTRSSRIPELTNIESLILAQAVWEHGANAWPAVAKILTKHPLISRPKSFFTAQTCHNIYNHLMKEADLECTDANYSARASANLKLAEKYYNKRFEELRSLLLAEEVKFKTILSEIDDIRSGHWDDEIKAKVTGIPTRPIEPQTEVTLSLSEIVPDEVYEGSDLSGVTDTPPSQSQNAKDDILIGKPTSPEETPEVEGVVAIQGPSRPVQSFPTRENSVDMPGAPSPIAIEIPSSDEEDQVEPLPANDVPSEVPALTSEPTIELPVLVDMSSSLPAEEQMPGEQNEITGNLPAEAHQHMECEFADADESTQQQQEEEEEEEDKEADAKEEEEEGEDDKEENTHARSDSPVTDVLEPMQSTQNQDTIPDMASGSGELASATSVEPEPKTEHEEANEDEIISSGEEPLQVIRRSTRRRRSSTSSVQPLQARGRKNRRHKLVSTEAPDTPPVILDVEAEQSPGTDKEVTMDSPKEEDQDFSPAASEVAFPRHQDGKRKASFVEGIGSPRERKRPRDDSEPAEEDEPGPSSSISRGRRRTDRTEEQKRFQNVITMLHSQISQHRNGNIFHNPIKPSEAPDYHEIVKRPMDLKSIKMKVKDGVIASSLEFQRDIYLMFANAMIYNRPGSDVYSMAEEMMFESEAHILAFRQTEGFVRGTHR